MNTEVARPTGGGSVTPAGPATNPPAQPTGNRRPAAGNSASREIQRRPGAAIAYNLAAYSNLDEICTNMTLLNRELGVFLDTLAVLRQSSTALDATITNVDELAQFYEATSMTRSAINADSTVCMIIDDLVEIAQDRGFTALQLNALGYDALARMRASQEALRAQGAGPRLLATAGRA